MINENMLVDHYIGFLNSLSRNMHIVIIPGNINYKKMDYAYNNINLMQREKIALHI